MASTPTHTPTIEEQIKDDLERNGRSTVAEIARRIGYSNGYVREKAKALRERGEIAGEKGKVIPAYIINGNFVVLTGDKEEIIETLKKVAPHVVARVRGMPVSEIHAYIRKEVADGTTAASRRWKFWI